MIVREVQLVHDPDGLRLGLEALKGHREVLRLDLLSAGQPPEEVHVPEGAAVLAVGDGLQADRLLLLHQAADLCVLDLGQFLGGDGAGFKPGAGFMDGGGAQKAADNIIAIGSGILHGIQSFLFCGRAGARLFSCVLVYKRTVCL